MNILRLKHWGQILLVVLALAGTFFSVHVQAKVYENDQDPRSVQSGSADQKSGKAGTDNADFVSAGITLITDQIADINKPWWKKAWDFTKDDIKFVASLADYSFQQMWNGTKAAAVWTGDKIVTGAKIAGFVADNLIRYTFESSLHTLSFVLPPLLQLYDKVSYVVNPYWPLEKAVTGFAWGLIDHYNPEDVKKDGDLVAWDSSNNECVDQGKTTSDLSRSSAGKRHILYVNGIHTTFENHCGTLKHIHDVTCCDVSGIYNASEGYIPDTWQSGIDKDENILGSSFYTSKNIATQQLVDELRSQNDNSDIELWCHSQGGIICSNALYRISDEDSWYNSTDIKNLKVESFGSAATSWPDGPKYEHMADVQDIVAIDLGQGDSIFNTKPNMVYFSGAEGVNYNFDNPVRKPIKDLTMRNHSMDDTYLPAFKLKHPEYCNN